MDRGLVNVSVTQKSHELLVEAAEHAAGADAELVLLSMLTTEQAEHDLEVMDRIGDVERVDFGESQADLAKEIGQRVAAHVLEDYDVEYAVVGKYVTDDSAHRVVEVAQDRDCDHIFLLGRRRQGFGALFGRDRIQTALDEFDGFATVGRETAPEKRFAQLVDEDEPITGDFVEFYQTYL